MQTSNIMESNKFSHRRKALAVGLVTVAVMVLVFIGALVYFQNGAHKSYGGGGFPQQPSKLEILLAKISREAGPEGDLTKVNPTDRADFLRSTAGLPVTPEYLLKGWIKSHPSDQPSIDPIIKPQAVAFGLVIIALATLAFVGVQFGKSYLSDWREAKEILTREVHYWGISMDTIVRQAGPTGDLSKVNPVDRAQFIKMIEYTSVTPEHALKMWIEAGTENAALRRRKARVLALVAIAAVAFGLLGLWASIMFWQLEHLPPEAANEHKPPAIASVATTIIRTLG